MSIGQGNISVDQKQSTGGGAGNTIYSGDGTLAGNRQVNLDGNTLSFFSQDATDNFYFLVDPVDRIFCIGDYGGSQNGTFLIINDTKKEINFYTGSNNLALLLDGEAKEYQLGDLEGSGGGTEIRILDTNKTFLFVTDNGANSFLEINADAGIYTIGDISQTNNGCIFSIIDAGSAFTLGKTNYLAFAIDLNNNIFGLGDLEGNGNSSKITINDNTQLAEITGKNGIYLNGDTNLVHTTVSYGNGAAAQIGTLTNAPAAGNPTKWIPIDDNGTTRYIPAW